MCGDSPRPIHSLRPARSNQRARTGRKLGSVLKKVVDVVSSDQSVLDFPKAEITSEEKARRAMAEAKRLASLSPGEWRLWIDRSAERLGVPVLLWKR